MPGVSSWRRERSRGGAHPGWRRATRDVAIAQLRRRMTTRMMSVGRLGRGNEASLLRPRPTTHRTRDWAGNPASRSRRRVAATAASRAVFGARSGRSPRSRRLKRLSTRQQTPTVSDPTYVEDVIGTRTVTSPWYRVTGTTAEVKGFLRCDRTSPSGADDHCHWRDPTGNLVVRISAQDLLPGARDRDRPTSADTG